jgi:hypothetical protein
LCVVPDGAQISCIVRYGVGDNDITGWFIADVFKSGGVDDFIPWKGSVYPSKQGLRFAVVINNRGFFFGNTADFYCLAGLRCKGRG